MLGVSWVPAMARMAKAKVKARKARAKESARERTKVGGKGNRDRDICRLCHQPGHWGNECPLYSANQATSTSGGNGSQQDSTSTTIPSSQGGSRQTSSSTTASVSTAGSSRTSTIRQVRMYHVATPPSEMPEIFELNSDEDEWWPSSSVRAVVFSMADGEEDFEMLEKDELYDWYIADDKHIEEDIEVYKIQTVRHDDDLIVLDWELMFHCFPMRWATEAYPLLADEQFWKMLKAIESSPMAEDWVTSSWTTRSRLW